MKYSNINEETLKNCVADDFFSYFDCNETIRNIDFTVRYVGDAFMRPDSERKSPFPTYFLWAEAKAQVTNPIEMLTQLILTIGKSKLHLMEL